MTLLLDGRPFLAHEMIAALINGCEYPDIVNPTGPFERLRHDGSGPGKHVPFQALRAAMDPVFVNGIGRTGCNRPYLLFTATEDFSRMEAVLRDELARWSGGPIPRCMIKAQGEWYPSERWTRVPS